MSTALRSVDPGNISLPRLSGLNRRLAGIPSLHVGAAVLSVLLGGLLLSISTTRDPLWWHLHFSQLGIFGDFSSALFNTTLKVSGAMVIVLAHFVRRDILRLGRGAVRRGSATLACACLHVVGIDLALVGFVPLNTDKDLHDRVAALMVLGFLVLLASAPVMLHRLGRRMAVSTGVALIWLALSITLFVTASINLALFETISCGAMFAWTGMLTHTLGTPAASAGRRTDAADDRGACLGRRRLVIGHRRPPVARAASNPRPAPARPTAPLATTRRGAAHGPATRAAYRARSDTSAPALSTVSRVKGRGSSGTSLTATRSPGIRPLAPPRRMAADLQPPALPRRMTEIGAASRRGRARRLPTPRPASCPAGTVSAARGTRAGSPDARRRRTGRARRRRARLDALGAARSLPR